MEVWRQCFGGSRKLLSFATTTRHLGHYATVSLYQGLYREYETTVTIMWSRYGWFWRLHAQLESLAKMWLLRSRARRLCLMQPLQIQAFTLQTNIGRALRGNVRGYWPRRISLLKTSATALIGNRNNNNTNNNGKDNTTNPNTTTTPPTPTIDNEKNANNNDIDISITNTYT